MSPFEPSFVNRLRDRLSVRPIVEPMSRDCWNEGIRQFPSPASGAKPVKVKGRYLAESNALINWRSRRGGMENRAFEPGGFGALKQGFAYGRFSEAFSLCFGSG